MKRFDQYTLLTINGEKLQGTEIVDYCRESAEIYMQYLGEFVAEWISPDPFITLQTSGSTGKPRTMQVFKEQMLMSASLTAQYFGFAAGQKALLCLPVQYIAGKMMVVRAFLSDLDLVCVRPSNNPLQKLPSHITIDFAPLTPMQLHDNDKLRNVKQILLGGAPVSSSLEKKLLNLSPAIYHGFGMTETLSHIAVRRINGPKATRIYSALPGISLDTDDRSCLVIKAPFLGNEVVTNDVVELRDESSFIWKGRYDFVINSGGIKLFPEELEEKIAGCVACRYFFCGLKDEQLGEKLCLFLEGKPFDLTGLKLMINEKLGRFEKPREVFFVDRFEETASGKVNRPATVERWFEKLRQ